MRNDLNQTLDVSSVGQPARITECRAVASPGSCRRVHCGVGGPGTSAGSAGLLGPVRLRPSSSLVLLLTLLLLPGLVNAELIDCVVATVNNEVITLTELKQAVGFNMALGGSDREKVTAETLEGLINRRLLIQEAYRLRFVEVSDEEVNAEIEKLKKRLGSDKAFNDFLAGLDMTKEQLVGMLAERLLVERFIEKKIGLFIRVSHLEAQDYFTRHPSQFKAKRFEEVQKAIIAGLSEQKLEQQTTEYLAELKGRAEIRVNR